MVEEVQKETESITTGNAPSLEDTPRTGTQKDKLDELANTVHLVQIVLFIGFAAAFIAVGGLVVNYLAEKKASYEDLKNKVLETNFKIDNLTNEIQQGRLPKPLK
jgi:beta-lactamase regulating signal transducer with metallopeptidase domain